MVLDLGHGETLTPFLLALGLSFVLTGALLPVLRRAEFLDVPNSRSSHAQPIPRGGGLAVVVALVLVTVLTVPRTASVWAVVGAVIVLSAVGMADDRRPLGSGIRLLAQLVASLASGWVLVAHHDAAWWWIPVLVVAMAGYVNAFNFMDGINAISGLTCAGVGIYWGIAGHLRSDSTVQTLGLVLAGAAVGFLPWNAPRAKVFLGDVGSYGIGMFVASISALAAVSGFPVLWVVAPLLVYGADTGWVLLKRWRGGRPLTEAHREHVYQRLVDRGAHHLASAAVCTLVGALICAVVLWADGSPQPWAIAAAAVMLIAYLALPGTLGKKGSR